MKRCSICGVEKCDDAFPVRKNRPGGSSHCKLCISARNKAYYAKNAEKLRQDKAEYRESHPQAGSEYQAAYREKNSAKLRDYFKAYAKQHPHKKQAVTVSRRANKLQATPSWANQNYIVLFYKLARLESERTGEKVHVDHIVPLKGSLVCGLHNEHNLQLLTASANLKKSNLVWPNMPTSQ